DPALAQQCFITSEPVTLELQGVKTRVFMIGDTGFDPYNQVLVTTRAYYESHKDQCARLVKAVAAGWRAYLDDPKPFNRTMAGLNAAMSVEAMDLGAEKQRALSENDETRRIGLGGMRVQRWQSTIEQLSDLGRIKSRPDAARLFAWDAEAGTAR
ncbi:MAG: ABC transporter substrate-binding protein, partial [Planctomycetota bacterium]